MGFSSYGTSVETIRGKPQAPDETQVHYAIRGCESVLKIAVLTHYFSLVLPTWPLQSCLTLCGWWHVSFKLVKYFRMCYIA